MREIKTTKEKILDRTMHLIGKKGTVELSVREIAKEAGVNVASINYHFKTKENMFNELDTFYISNMKDAYKWLEDNSETLENRLLLWMEDFSSYFIKYPGAVILHREKQMLFNKDGSNSEIVELGNYYDTLIDKHIRLWIGPSDEENFIIKRVSFYSSLTGPFLNNKDPFLDSITNRRKYFRYLLEVIKND